MIIARERRGVRVIAAAVLVLTLAGCGSMTRTAGTHRAPYLYTIVEEPQPRQRIIVSEDVIEVRQVPASTGPQLSQSPD